MLTVLFWLGSTTILTIKLTQLRITWEESLNVGWPVGICVMRECCLDYVNGTVPTSYPTMTKHVSKRGFIHL